ncbi:GNAT family N-acetyltransferase [Arthrobacter rhombi]|uniref:GNAT family N-acetyltransferase n=1 Tax=Arthrobacter rhombi TaxID=71253 RepID=UPI003FD65FF6
MSSVDTSASRRFIEAIRMAASEELGHGLPPGTTVLGSRSREGSRKAVAYPMGEPTLITCAPRLVARLGSIDGGPALSNDAFVSAATALGGTPASWGRFRVFEGVPSDPDLDPARVVPLDRDQERDRAIIAEFIAACTEDDLAAAELEMDHLDPSILGVQSDDGVLGALAFGRPWPLDDRFNDVGIVTAPEYRGRGLGRAAVAQFVRQQHDRGRLSLYNCDVDNIGSDRLADSLGFTLVQTVASVRFTCP